MNSFRYVKTALAVFTVLFLLNSCESALTSSWGKGLVRDPDKVEVSASNAEDLLKSARGNPEQSAAILSKIKGKINDSSGEEKVALQKAAVKAAVQASGVDILLIDNAKKVKDIADMPADKQEKQFRELMDSILADTNDIGQVKNDISDIFAADIQGNQFKPGSYGTQMGDSEKMLVAATIVLGKAHEKNGDFTSYVEELKNKNMTNPTGLEKDEQVVYALYNGIDEKMWKDSLGL